MAVEHSTTHTPGSSELQPAQIKNPAYCSSGTPDF